MAEYECPKTLHLQQDFPPYIHSIPVMPQYRLLRIGHIQGTLVAFFLFGKAIPDIICNDFDGVRLYGLRRERNRDNIKESNKGRKFIFLKILQRNLLEQSPSLAC